MKQLADWYYNEFQHVGVDYADPVLATEYDMRHERFRGDMSVAADQLLDTLEVASSQILLDIGCGTGTFAIQAARRCSQVYAIDVSPAMLEVARHKADAAGVHNIVFAQAGFLTYEHEGEAVDCITSTAALHHLPDFWKQIGLQRIQPLLKDAGIFYLMDTVYSFQAAQYDSFFDEKVAWFSKQVGPEFGQEVAQAIREEYSTLDWIMEGLLMRAGFIISRAEYADGMMAQYWCRKGG